MPYPPAGSRGTARFAGACRPIARLAALAAFALAMACGGDGAVRVPDGPPVVLVSIDTLRSDRLPAYGYGGVATPAIDALRRDSILFEHAYAPVPLTLPSHASALTGLLPPDHGVRDNMGYRLDAASVPYLPRTLAELGYATGAAVSSFVLRGTSGLDASFDFYEDELAFEDFSGLGSVQRPGTETLERTLPWLESVADRPFFLFFHIYEPHTPYRPPEPYASRYESPYDGDVAFADEIVGKLLLRLQELGVYDESIVILMSDHGEGLGEHGYQEHGPLLYREALQVPLMLKLPGGERGGSSVETPAQLPDVYTTVVSLLGRETPPGVAGESLLELAEPGTEPRRIYSETLFPRLHFGWSDLASLIEYPHHYIHGPDPELYDLAADPAETNNILRRERRLATRLAGQIEGMERSLEAPGQEDAETMRKLAALGYLGGGASLETEGPLPDPKARLHVLDKMRDALDLTAAGDHEAAVPAFRAVLAEEPGMADAWEKLGLLLLEIGRQDESIAALQEAMKWSGGAPQIALSMADAFLRMNRLDEAEAHAEIALTAHELARDVLAQVALRKGELERAAELSTRAVELRGARLGPLITLANVRLEQERFAEAAELTRQVESEYGDRGDRAELRGVYFIRGSALAQLGDSAAAETAFRRELELSPDQLAPYTHLAFLLALEGRGPEAGATLQRMVEANPRPEAYAEASRTLDAMGDPRSARAVLGMGLRRWPNDPELRELAGG